MEADMKTAGMGLALLLAGAAFLGAQAAYIREVRGTVEVRAPGAAEWKAAAAGEALERASLISTGFRSTALITIGNSTLTVRPLTRLSLEEIAASQSGERVTIDLRAGRVRAEVKPPAGGKTDFTVRTPTTTASVRGTVFEFDGIRVKVDEGRVHLGGTNLTGAYVGAGRSTEADPETGKTAAAAERAKEALAPALPAGVDAAPAIPAAPSRTGDLEAGFEWK
jgi:hypothetical protein